MSTSFVGGLLKSQDLEMKSGETLLGYMLRPKPLQQARNFLEARSWKDRSIAIIDTL